PFARAKRPPGYRGVAARAAIAQCMSKRGRGVPITSRACRFQSWGLEAGAPAGLPADAPAGLPGKRLGYRGTRPPHYVHIIIYAGRGNPANKLFPFAWPRRRVRTIGDSLLRPSRRLPIALAHVRWANHDGELVLAPPLVFGGEVGDHLIFHWRASGVDHVVSLHSWAPLGQAA